MEELRTALTNDEFVVHLQPQSDPRNGSIVGAEAPLHRHHARAAGEPTTCCWAVLEEPRAFLLSPVRRSLGESARGSLRPPPAVACGYLPRPDCWPTLVEAEAGTDNSVDDGQLQAVAGWVANA
jgi:hypothetical protein